MTIRGPILVATDLSEPADAALRQGRDIASSLGVPLLIGHVLPKAFRARVLFPQDAGIDIAVQHEIKQCSTRSKGRPRRPFARTPVQSLASTAAR